LEIDEKVLGTDHPGTATDYSNIGTLYYQMKEYPEALKYLEKALQICKAKLGDEHPYTIGTQEWIDATIAAMNK
jgi:tetratricopeptide (TPR) repeat protein